jgi:hypothetical protein
MGNNASLVPLACQNTAQENFEETRVKRDNDWAGFLKEGAVCALLFYNGKVISVDPPQFVDLIVQECPPNVKGNTASGGGSKPGIMETGATVMVGVTTPSGSADYICTVLYVLDLKGVFQFQLSNPKLPFLLPMQCHLSIGPCISCACPHAWDVHGYP